MREYEIQVDYGSPFVLQKVLESLLPVRVNNIHKSGITRIGKSVDPIMRVRGKPVIGSAMHANMKIISVTFQKIIHVCVYSCRDENT
jgi:hypothetical protein